MNFFPRQALALLGCACIVSSAAMSAEPDRAPALLPPPPPPPGLMMGGHGPGPGPGPGPGSFALRGVDLDEAQQDKVFAIVHAQEPQMREQEKAARHAHEALRAMAASGQFDEPRAAALAQTGAKAMAAIALQQARTDAQINALLTPEQRRQAAERAPRREPRP